MLRESKKGESIILTTKSIAQKMVSPSGVFVLFKKLIFKRFDAIEFEKR